MSRRDGAGGRGRARDEARTAPGTQRRQAAGVHRFRVAGRRFLLDVGTGALFGLSLAAWRAAGRLLAGAEAGRGGAGGGQGGRCGGPGGVGGSPLPRAGGGPARGAAAELHWLIREGLILSPQPQPPKGAAPRPGLRALCLNLAAACNLRCTYCFAQGQFEAPGPKLMPREVAERAIDFLLENSGPDPGVEIDFFGGEPLLNLEVLQAAVSYALRRGREAGKRFRFTVTTNGLLLTPEVGRYLDEAMHNVVLSLDGRPRVHDAHRRLPDGSGSFSRVFPNLRRFVAQRGQRDYWVRGTYTSLNRDFSRDALFLARAGFAHVSLEPVVAAASDPLALRPEHLPRLRAEYDRLARACLSRARAGRPFEFFHFRVDRERGPCLARRAGGCGAGRDYLAVSPEGGLYPCHQFIGRPGFRLGDVYRGLQPGPVRDYFAAVTIYSKPACSQCWGRFYCGGGCHANAHLLTGDLSTPDPLGCRLFLARLERALYLAAEVPRGRGVRRVAAGGAAGGALGGSSVDGGGAVGSSADGGGAVGGPTPGVPRPRGEEGAG
ncbi:MAG: thioether cross-link-forming SCIFF peptide maturase [Acetobacteraceae bacterium]|nr:thioether cross-link-forming SCIFF peptide maturase [Acetobacteraceae bacterium]